MSESGNYELLPTVTSSSSTLIWLGRVRAEVGGYDFERDKIECTGAERFLNAAYKTTNRLYAQSG